MTFKKLVGKIHLWLGLASGVVVFIVAITGCLYVFKNEIQSLQSYRYVESQQADFLPPSELGKMAEKELPGEHAHSVIYGGKDDAAEVIFYEHQPRFYHIAFLNPYNGEVQNVKDVDSSFFTFVLDGHNKLWLPEAIGKTIVDWATVIFVVMMISGLILWWPKKQNMKQRFSIKWSARWRRVNYDLHNVLGFYMTWVAIFIAITGLVMGFQWFKGTIYQATGGDKALTWSEPPSDTTKAGHSEAIPAVDAVWNKVKADHSEAASVEIHFPHDSASTIFASINPASSTHWKTDFIFYDQYTLEEKKPDHIWGKFSKASVADKLMRMNYDIHVGAILGFPGKLLAFFGSLIAAGLPVTGFYIWWGRKKKKRKKRDKQTGQNKAMVNKRVMEKV